MVINKNGNKWTCCNDISIDEMANDFFGVVVLNKSYCYLGYLVMSLPVYQDAYL